MTEVSFFGWNITLILEDCLLLTVFLTRLAYRSAEKDFIRQIRKNMKEYYKTVIIHGS